MAFPSSTRCCLDVFGSASRSTRAAQLHRLHRFILPSLVAPRSISQQPPSSSNNSPTPKSSNPVVPSSPPTLQPPSFLTPKPLPSSEPIFFDFEFSSITTSEDLASLLKIARSVTSSEVALLPELERLQRTTALSILTKASNMDPEQRTTYFKEVDTGFLSPDVAKQSRRQKAKEQIESGRYDEKDALSVEDWDEQLRVEQDARVETLIETKGWSREKALKQMKRDLERMRRQRLDRLEVRTEMKEGEEEGKGSK